MPLADFIERVLASGVLSRSMVQLRSPASSEDIDAAEKRLGSPLPNTLRALLERWDGANLDVVRLVSCESLNLDGQGLYFANDPSGFMYFLDQAGQVVSIDTDGGAAQIVAPGLDDFLTGYVFGTRSHEFMGTQWLTELRAAGLAT